MSQSKKLSHAEILELTDDLAAPFAKALATFVKEARGRSASEADLEGKLQKSEQLQRTGRAYIEKLEARYRELEKEGMPMENVNFRELHQPRPTLKVLAMQKRMTQKQLAKKAGMDAAMLSRVLRNPDRSTLATIKRIVHALGARMGDVDLEAA